MRILLSGGGMVGLVLARMLRARGFEPIVIERMKPGQFVPRGYMMGFQGHQVFDELGLMDRVRDAGWPIAPNADGTSVAVCVAVGHVLNMLAEDLPVEYEHTVVDLLRDDTGRITGVVVEGPDGRREIESDLVVACDGIRSPVREMAGLEAEFTPLPDAEIAWMTHVPSDTSFHMRYLADGGYILMLGWPEGTGGFRSCEKVGREAALAPGLDALKEMFARLLPECAPGLEGLTSMDQVVYTEPTLLRCPRWWVPGLIIIGDAAHYFGPETGASSGVGMQDAQALAQAIQQFPEHPDAVCAQYESWRVPAVRPLEDADPSRERIATHAQRQSRPDEVWPPQG